MNFKRLGITLICLLLVCCMIVDVSPIKAEAFAAELVVTGVAAAGAIGLLYLAMAGGAVYVPEGLSTFNAVGTAFQEYMYQWGSTAEQLEEMDEFFGGLTLYGGSPDGDDGEDIDRFVRPLDWIRRGAALFTAAAILAECAIVEQKEVPAATGWTYYGDTLLPTAPTYSECPYTICYFDDDTYYFHHSSSPLRLKPSNSYLYATKSCSVCKDYVKVSTVNSWNESSNYSHSSISTISSGKVASYYCTEILWSNYDIYSYTDGSLLHSAGSDPCTSFVKEVEVVPDSYVTDTKEQLANAIISANDLIVPDINYANLIGSDGSVLTGIQDVLRRLNEGIITHEEFMEIVVAPAVQPEPEPEPEPDPSEDPTEDTTVATEVPSPDVDTDVGEETLANTNAATFLDNLANVITTPFKWIWGKIETFFTPLLKPELWLDPLPDIALEPAKWIWEKAETFFEPLLNPDALKSPFEWIWGKIEPIPGQITDAVADAATQVEEAVDRLIQPEEDYLTDKVSALCAEFAFADSIVRTGQALHLGLANITTEPPVIYIDLGATRGSYNIGGRVPFIDMTWYAEYKPTADALISAFLWIVFVWRMLIHLPGIISGASGIFTLQPMPSTQTTPISSIDSGELKWRDNPDGSATPYGSYSELLKQYHEDYYDLGPWGEFFGRNPSYEVLQDIYTISAEDMGR